MNTEDTALHDKLDKLHAEIKTQIIADPDKFKELMIYFLDILNINFKKLTR